MKRRDLSAASSVGAAGALVAAKYDAKNPAALRRFVGGGAQLRPFGQEIMEASFKASNEVYNEISAKNADFRYDNFMIRACVRGGWRRIGPPSGRCACFETRLRRSSA